MATVLGNKIRVERKKLGFTLDHLAGLIDSSKSYVWELENKDDINPTAEKISKLATALKVPVEYLLNDKQEELTELDNTKSLWRRYENLTPDKKATIEAVLSALENGSKS
ncbi:MAG TPA: helix-turn-helix transcriptional regulator [Methylotenera sp.]|nr:helix-turn-helix transcriptional regulator [Methylotenera sp.]HPH07987.1 helix-turn-helix transcriptional regulator [Methylotenera sp.]HPM50028.1 helix-turn-helix transcriptional regulator [Methylotenera sp.]